jgi:hypothetical protein
MTRSCAATRCTAPVKPGMLMCKPHWFSLPASLRSAIWGAYRARGHDRATYQDHVRAAVDLIDAMPGPFEADQGAFDVSSPVAIGPRGEAIRYEHGRLL